jgi:hypothetical protein
VQEDGADLERLLEVAVVATLDDLLVFVERRRICPAVSRAEGRLVASA